MVTSAAAAAAKSLQSCPTLCYPTDCSLPGSSIHGIFQARILQWVAISTSRGSSWPSDQTCISCISFIVRQMLYHWAMRETKIIMNKKTCKLVYFNLFWKQIGMKMYIHILVVVQSLSHVWLLANPWTAAHQASLSITNSGSLFKLMSIELVMPSNHLILCVSFSSCLQSFPASRFFQWVSSLHQVAKVSEFQLQWMYRTDFL